MAASRDRSRSPWGTAASVIVALPKLLVFFVLQRQFVAGLTLGATKG